MFSIRMTLVASLITISIALPAYAGRKTSATVVINTATRTASGGYGSARNSADTIQYIGCQGTFYPNLDPNSGSFSQHSYYCYARNSAGTTAACTIPLHDGALDDIYPTLGDDSFLRFTWDAAGNCTSLRIENYSYYAPVQP